jgi:hypothetical protein
VVFFFFHGSSVVFVLRCSINNRFFLAGLSSLTFVSLVFTDVWFNTIVVGTAVVVFTPQR